MWRDARAHDHKPVRLPGLPAVSRLTVLAAVLAAALVPVPSALAQGGASAPDFDDPCPAVYPGQGASKASIARWMAGGAAARGLPWELPVMAGLAESGLSNLRGASYSGFFGMSQALNAGDYRGFPKRPDLQLRWFLDTAVAVRQRRVAEGRPDPAADPAAFGLWVADIERPAPENRSGYQKYLEQASGLAGDGCPAPVRADSVAPGLQLKVAARQRPLSAGGITLRLRCPGSRLPGRRLRERRRGQAHPHDAGRRGRSRGWLGHARARPTEGRAQAARA